MADIITTNLDAGTDSPALARPQILEAVQRVNDLTSPAVGKGAAGVVYKLSEIGSAARKVLDKLDDYVNLLDFGADFTGATDCSAAVNAAIATGRAIYAPEGTYACNVIYPSNIPPRIFGDGMTRTLFKPYLSSAPCIMVMYRSGEWAWQTICDIGFIDTLNTSTAVSLGNPTAYASGDELIGRIVFERCKFFGLNKGVFKTCGNIGNVFRDCLFRSNNYGVFAQDSARVGGSAMHAFADIYDGCQFTLTIKSALCYLNRTPGAAMLKFKNTFFELNPGFCIAIDSVGAFGPSYVFDNCWFERNATASSATIDIYSGTYTGAPQDVYAKNIRNLIFKETVLGKITLVNSHMTTMNCDTLYATSPSEISITRDSASTVVHLGSQSDFWGDDDNLMMAPYANQQASSAPGSSSPVYSTLPVFLPVDSAGAGTIIWATNNTGIRTLYGNTSNIAPVLVRDGMTYNRCLQASLAAVSRYLVLTAASSFADTFTLTAGKWYVCTIQARRASGAGLPTFQIRSNTTALGRPVTIDHAAWRNYTIVATPESTDSQMQLRLIYDTATASVINLGVMQIVQFDTQQEAAEYAYSGKIASCPDGVNQPKSASYPFCGTTRLPARVTFNSANYCVDAIGTAAAIEVLRADFGGVPSQIVVDLLGSYTDGTASPIQDSGIRSIAFTTVAATPTSVFGGATLTFSWVLISGSTYALMVQITSGTPTSVGLVGVAFVKGR